MTRDKALKIMSRIWGGNPQHGLAKSYVEAFVEMGILKLEEPKSASDKFINVLEAHVEHKYIGDILNEMESVGLKIVEK